MKRLEDAWAWYQNQLARLKHIQALSQEHDQDPHLRGLLGSLLSLAKGKRKVELGKEREDIYRVALVRLFAGFEADFREAFFNYVVAHTGMTKKQVDETLPDAVSTWLIMFRVLEPSKLSESSLGEINRIRDERNRLAHGGFHQAMSHTSPDEAYAALKRPLEAISASLGARQPNILASSSAAKKPAPAT